MSDILRTVYAVNGEDIPDNIEEWCIDNEISTHCECGLHSIEDDGNPFSEWLKSIGYDFKGKSWGWVGVWGT